MPFKGSNLRSKRFKSKLRGFYRVLLINAREGALIRRSDVVQSIYRLRLKNSG